MDTKALILDRLSILVARVDERLVAYFEREYDYVKAPGLSVDLGRRYAKVIRGESVYFFVDLTSGDILKPASWRAPAKGARASVLDGDYGIRAIGPHGAGYKGVDYSGAW